MILQSISGIVTAAGATLTGITMLGTDVLTLYAFQNPKLLTFWVDSQANGDVRIMSPNQHDFNQGIHVSHVASEVYPLWPLDSPIPLKYTDTLTAQLSGSATAADIETLTILLAFPTSGVGKGAPTYITYDQYQQWRTGLVMGVQNTIATPTSGAYTAEAINAEFDNFKSGFNYAVLGITTNTEAAVLTLQGPCTGNYRIGVPGHETNKRVNVDFFLQLAKALQKYNWPCIPVFKGNDKGTTLVGCAVDENGADPTLSANIEVVDVPAGFLD
jgi:hypothetical protein